MAEFQKVTEEAKRMCWYYTRKGSHAGCPMYPACNVSQCRKIAFERPAEFEGRVMSWAAEHPETVYPTWLEWLKSMGVIPYMMGLVTIRDEDGTFDDGHVNITENALKEIPADIAQKLGLKPKEG